VQHRNYSYVRQELRHSIFRLYTPPPQPSFCTERRTKP